MAWVESVTCGKWYEYKVNGLDILRAETRRPTRSGRVIEWILRRQIVGICY